MSSHANPWGTCTSSAPLPGYFPADASTGRAHQAPHSLDYPDYPDYLSPSQHYAPRTGHGYYQASRSGFSGLATRHVQSPDSHGRPGIRFHGAWNLLELWTTSRAALSQQSCHPSPMYLFAPGTPAAGIRLLSGCRWDGTAPASAACFCHGIVAQPRIPDFSILAADRHMLPFRSIPLLSSTVLPLLCTTGL